MGIVQPASSDALDSVADHIFDLLWGEERDPIPSAGDHAYQRIWRQLITGARQPGEHLSDVELAAELGVSRTPVREALRRLVEQELVRADPRRGFWVREFTTRDVREFYDVRAALEALALREGADRIAGADLQDQLDQIAALRGRLAEPPVLAFLQHDFQFHNLIIHASGNGRLIRLLASLRSQVSLFQIRDTGYAHRLAIALDGHERVLRALLEGDTIEAARRLDDHITMSRDGVLEDFFALPIGEHGAALPSPARGARGGVRGARDRPPPGVSPPFRGNGARGTTRQRLDD
jgi:DNA-binding GntR family transcriptional regulator